MMRLRRGGEEGWLTSARAACGALWRSQTLDYDMEWTLVVYGPLRTFPATRAYTPAAALVCTYRTREWSVNKRKKKEQGVSHPGGFILFS